LGAAVEVKDPRREAGKVAGVHPFAMELLLYRPGAACPPGGRDTQGQRSGK
jgi:hypothetical protein